LVAFGGLLSNGPFPYGFKGSARPTSRFFSAFVGFSGGAGAALPRMIIAAGAVKLPAEGAQ
jgi:hypothetical protein